MGICTWSISVLAIKRSIFTGKQCFCTKSSSKLKIKYCRFQNMWNLKIDVGTIFWYILTLRPHNSKSSLPTTGTFQYVESHLLIRDHDLWTPQGCLLLTRFYGCSCLCACMYVLIEKSPFHTIWFTWEFYHLKFELTEIAILVNGN